MRRSNGPGPAPRQVVPEGRGAIELYPRVGDDRFSDAWMARATWGFVALGVTIRVVRFLLDQPLWGDECFVAANLIDREYLGLLRPLDYQQVAPVLFLWAELTSTRLLGFSEWSLRLFPALCSIASLFVFRLLATRLLKGLPALMGVAIVAVSLNPIRHAGEVKPYAVDFLASAAMLAMLVEWWRRPDRAGWIWGLAASAPVAMGLSLPSAFVAGGVSLAMLGRVARDRRPGVVAAYLAMIGAIVASAMAILIVQGGSGSAEVKAYMDHYWSGLFPPLEDPGRLALWMVRAHTGQLFAHPAGGANGASLVTVVLAATGMVDLWKRGRGAVVVACVAPLGLALVASAARLYPYGESERLMQFAGPMVCLVAGHGLAWSLGRFRRAGSYRTAALACLVGFAALGAGAIGFEIVHPYKTPRDSRTREFARWFWSEAGLDAELACARVDLGLDFQGGPPHDGRSADYLTYREIYLRRGPIRWRTLGRNHPLRCVLYDGVPVDSTLFERWMARMNPHYRLSRVETYRVNAGFAPRSVSYEDHIAVLDFIPIGEPVDPIDLAKQATEADRKARSARGSLSVAGPIR